ncbi:MogA/MoaB family molybdenum cofactor biosynthesis protein [Deinococcus arenicola]|uniref:Molybdenum cofactor biosynthesis protein B n=1 Tax=Deinococcus arenicola TaxID=2994950 RepID=A0ABU4DQM4_9DEIO|nr:molybdenum cofactor biosynthesis protein B [Deinococcus sp. ZS9-10]MDV6374746.1 molybdenum cofactor biosynthesis protein MoaB [Deinococcus sp. ZS9-10]
MPDASRPPESTDPSGSEAGEGRAAPFAQATPPASSTQHRAAAPTSVRVAVLTISDTRTPDTDTSGQYLLAELKAAGHTAVHYRVVRDDAVEIRSALTLLVRDATVVLSTGGTGLTGRDVTVPVVESMITKPIPGFGELFRMLSYQQVGGAAMLSRAVGGLCRGAAVFAMPGSLNAVQTAWEGILRDEIGHLAFEIGRHGQPGTGLSGTGQAGTGQVGGGQAGAAVAPAQASPAAPKPSAPMTPREEASPLPALPPSVPVPPVVASIPSAPTPPIVMPPVVMPPLLPPPLLRYSPPTSPSSPLPSSPPTPQPDPQDAEPQPFAPRAGPLSRLGRHKK